MRLYYNTEKKVLTLQFINLKVFLPPARSPTGRVVGYKLYKPRPVGLRAGAGFPALRTY